MPKIYTVHAIDLALSDEYSNVAQASKALQQCGFAEEMPFILLEDGQPLRVVNDWLLSLPTYGSASPRTWKAYAADLLDWYKFLTQSSTDLLAANKSDLAAYHADRRLGDGGSKRLLSSSSWNRKVSTLENFYRWAMDTELITKTPFTYRHMRMVKNSGGTTAVEKNLAKERTGRAHASMKWLEADQLQFFLDVGMNGLLPDGTEDPDFRGHNAARNRAFAQLMATTGMRVQEASHLLITELPQLPEKKLKFIQMDLPGVICKGRKARRILVPPTTIRDVLSYLHLERNNAQLRHGYQPRDPLPFTNLTNSSLVVNGKKTKLSLLTVEQRKRLVEEEKSPLIFLQANANPINQWQQVFDIASRRCQHFDPGFPHVSPHTMRHTFAVQMLRFLIEQVAAAIQREVDNTSLEVMAGYWRVNDPLLTLRDLMGHSSVATTQIYLTAIDATRLYVNIMDETASLEDDTDGE